MITHSRLVELFDYDVVTGRLVRKICVGRELPVTHGIAKNGYRIKWVDGKCYHEHRLVWLYHYKTIPKEIDHWNGNRADNRVENLRNCTRTLNNGNQTLGRTNTSGYKGVCRTPEGRWFAQIVCKKQHVYLGRHDTPEAAALAYNEAAIRLFGEFARLNNVEEDDAETLVRGMG